MNILNFKISGITCEACVKLIHKRLSRLPDAQNIQVNMDGVASVSSINELSKDDIRKALSDTSYKII